MFFGAPSYQWIRSAYGGRRMDNQKTPPKNKVRPAVTVIRLYRGDRNAEQVVADLFKAHSA